MNAYFLIVFSSHHLQVVLVLPFMEEDDQAHLFKPGTFFERPSDQESAMREWLDQVGGYTERATRRTMAFV